MYIIISLIILTAVLLIISVLVQNPKGGGVASGWGINTNQFGVRKTTDFLEKSTWVLVGLLLVLSISANSLYTESEDSDIPSSVNVEKAQENKVQLPSAEPAAQQAPASSDSNK
ncbi:MAG: preprotein translocase subunit SecG [Cytophagales bacterium]|nr:MAG: preprotein translocase subunit SecG [Cytophagales bacterium]